MTLMRQGETVKCGTKDTAIGLAILSKECSMDLSFGPEYDDFRAEVVNFFCLLYTSDAADE